MEQGGILDEVRALARQVGIPLTPEEEQAVARRLEEMAGRLRGLEAAGADPAAVPGGDGENPPLRG